MEAIAALALSPSASLAYNTRAERRRRPYATSVSQRSRSCVLAFASRTSRSPWHARGAHQHPSTRPRSSLKRRDQRGVLPEPVFIKLYAVATLTVLANHKRIAPLRWSPDVNMVTLALAVHRVWRAELYIGRDE